MHPLWQLLLVSGAALGITVTVDSFEAGNPGSNAIDVTSTHAGRRNIVQHRPHYLTGRS
jgi:hypothetical protein